MPKKKLDFYSLDSDTVSSSILFSNTTSNLMLPCTPRSLHTLHNELIRQNEDCLFRNKTIYTLFFHNKKISIFNPVAIKLLGTKYKSYQTEIIADEIAVIEGMMMGLHENVLRIYKWNEDLEFRKVREIRTHALLFLIQTKSLKNETKQVLYNIVMVLIKQKIERIDLFLDKILAIVNIDDINEMYFVKDVLVCEYLDGEKRVFDTGMKEVKDKNVEKLKMRIEVEKNVTIRQRYSWIEINYEKKNYLDVIEMGMIKQCVYVNEYVFVLGEDSIKILKFSK